jgi:DNA-binding CsgD family transcriptional regulator
MSVFHQSLHGMVKADDSRRLREVNHAACVMIQRPHDELVRLRIDDLAAPTALPTLEGIWAELLARGSRTGNWPLMTGDKRIIEIDYSAIARSSGGLHLIVFVVRRMPSTGGPEVPDGALPGALSQRETEVLRRLALGATGPEIAAEMILGVDTIRTHIRNLKRKLGARTLPHLIAIAIARGLLDARSPQM